jgi:hypothetical protein
VRVRKRNLVILQFNARAGNSLVTKEEYILVPWASISEHVSPYAAPAKRTAKPIALLWNIVFVYAAIAEYKGNMPQRRKRPTLKCSRMKILNLTACLSGLPPTSPDALIYTFPSAKSQKS